MISVDREDLDELNLFPGEAKNDKADVRFDGHSVKEPFDSTNADCIRRQIREKIDRRSMTAVRLSEKAAPRKLVNGEIEESTGRGKGVIGV